MTILTEFWGRKKGYRQLLSETRLFVSESIGGLSETRGILSERKLSLSETQVTLGERVTDKRTRTVKT
jgi:hypothetical protein